MAKQRKQNAMSRHDGHQVEDTTDADVIGNVPIVFTRNIVDAATADYDITTTHKIEVIDVIVQKRAANAAAANTVQVKSTASAISDAIDANINDNLIARAGQINDANATIVAGGVLRITVTKAGGNAAVFVTVVAIRRA